jgi:hypothetical protein
MLDYNKKRQLILEYKERYKSDILVETGTFLGATAAVLKEYFKKIYTIELQEDLAKKCIERFKNENSIEVFQGDSSILLKEIIFKLNSNTLFWLDAHYSSEFFVGKELIKTAKGAKETPIIEELEVILSDGLKNNVILIDDARCFNGENDYPMLSSLKSFLQKKGIAENQIRVKNDIIRIVP